MIQTKPFCFDCDTPVASLADAVFAPPWCDHEDCASAVFHGVCLMRWRERRDQVHQRVQAQIEAFRRHREGECGCE